MGKRQWRLLAFSLLKAGIMPCMVKPDQQARQVKRKTLTLKETGHI